MLEFATRLMIAAGDSQPRAPPAHDAPLPEGTGSLGVEASRETSRLLWRAYARRHLR